MKLQKKTSPCSQERENCFHQVKCFESTVYRHPPASVFLLTFPLRCVTNTSAFSDMRVNSLVRKNHAVRFRARKGARFVIFCSFFSSPPPLSCYLPIMYVFGFESNVKHYYKQQRSAAPCFTSDSHRRKYTQQSFPEHRRAKRGER